MSSFGTCKLCGEKISYSPDHIHNYGMHLIEKHPELDFAHFALMYEPTSKKNGNCSCGCGCDADDCIRRGKGGKHRARHYRTTSKIILFHLLCILINVFLVQSWKCSQNPLLCPRCGKKNAPLIKRQRHKLTGSTGLACMLLGCWPFCFLPFIISGSDLFYLYCKECGFYIGMYDRRVSAIDKGPPCRMPAADGDPQICGCH